MIYVDQVGIVTGQNDKDGTKIQNILNQFLRRAKRLGFREIDRNIYIKRRDVLDIRSAYFRYKYTAGFKVVLEYRGNFITHWVAMIRLVSIKKTLGGDKK